MYNGVCDGDQSGLMWYKQVEVCRKKPVLAQHRPSLLACGHPAHEGMRRGCMCVMCVGGGGGGGIMLVELG